MLISLFFVSLIGGRCYGDRDSTFGVAGKKGAIVSVFVYLHSQTAAGGMTLVVIF